MHQLRLPRSRIYNFGFVCAFFSIGSILVAFMMSPLIFSFPDMNSRCAWVLPLASLLKSSSDNERKTTEMISTSTESRNLAFPLAATVCYESYSTSLGNWDLPSAFLPAGASPLATSPLSLRSMCQLSVFPSLFLSVNEKTALPFFTASFRPASSDFSELFMTSKASEEGNASA